MKSYLTKCSCGNTTSKTYARANGGRCKPCVTGQPRQPRETAEHRQGRLIDSGYEAYAREEGYYDSPY
jgi:hypothetical protein